jgi:hypothetical protein
MEKLIRFVRKGGKSLSGLQNGSYFSTQLGQKVAIDGHASTIRDISPLNIKKGASQANNLPYLFII